MRSPHSNSPRSLVSTALFYVRTVRFMYLQMMCIFLANKRRVGDTISVITLIKRLAGLLDLLCHPCKWSLFTQCFQSRKRQCCGAWTNVLDDKIYSIQWFCQVHKVCTYAHTTCNSLTSALMVDNQHMAS